MNELGMQYEPVEDTMQGKYLTFVLDQEHYGLEIRVVTEIIGMQNITVVPDLPEFMKGVINLRGKIIPVIDVRMKFKKPPQPYHDRTCIIIVEIGDMPVGLIVDRVAEVLNIPDENIVAPPDGKTGFSNRYLQGIGKVGNEVKLLLDSNRLLSLAETDQLRDDRIIKTDS
jgi:purine-binding chemotaxis protein CheW